MFELNFKLMTDNPQKENKTKHLINLIKFIVCSLSFMSLTFFSKYMNNLKLISFM